MHASGGSGRHLKSRIGSGAMKQKANRYPVQPARPATKDLAERFIFQFHEKPSIIRIRHQALVIGVVLAAGWLRFDSPPAWAQTVPLTTTLPASGLLNDV